MQILWLWIFFGLLAPVMGHGGTAPLPAASIAVRVVGITDGDTIKVRMEGVQTVVRLEGIDAPEKKQAFGARAKEALGELVASGEVQLEVTGRDRYGRTLGRVWVRAPGSFRCTDVCKEMVRRGMAWHFVRYNKDPKLAAAELAARKSKRGLWVDLDSAAPPVAPWEFRKKPRKKP